MQIVFKKTSILLILTAVVSGIEYNFFNTSIVWKFKILVTRQTLEKNNAILIIINITRYGKLSVQVNLRLSGAACIENCEGFPPFPGFCMSSDRRGER